MMNYFSGERKKEYTYKGDKIVYYIQGSEEWSYPYPYEGDDSNLKSSGCGIFSMCVVIKRLSGIEIKPEDLAAYALKNGGRDDTGTNRPDLLAGLVKGGRDIKYNFRYDGDGLVNDYEKLWEVLSNGGCAMLNLRVGHIVAAIDCRMVNGERQMLIVDSACESNDARICEGIRETVCDTAVTKKIINAKGVCVGSYTGCAMYWTALDVCHDFNLIWKRNQ